MKLYEIFGSVRGQMLYEDVLAQHLMEKVTWSPAMLHKYKKYHRDENNLFLDTHNLMGHAKTKASPYLMTTSGVEGKEFSPSIILRAQPELVELINKAGLYDHFRGIMNHSLNLRGVKERDPRIAAFYGQKFVDKVLSKPEEAIKDLRNLAQNSSYVPDVGNRSEVEMDKPKSTSTRNIPQVIDDEIAKMRKTLSPEQRQRIMANGFKQEELRKQIADIFGKEVAKKKGVTKGRGFHHETDPGQIRHVIQHYFHQFL